MGETTVGPRLGVAPAARPPWGWGCRSAATNAGSAAAAGRSGERGGAFLQDAARREQSGRVPELRVPEAQGRLLLHVAQPRDVRSLSGDDRPLPHRPQRPVSDMFSALARDVGDGALPDSRRRAARWAALLVLGALAACAGGGSRSHPPGPPNPPPEPPPPPPPPETVEGREALIATVATRDACFVVAKNEDERLSTSWATGQLAIAGYYVFQLFEDVGDVVATLMACAIDAGEPGVDDEFGLGVVSLACDEVEDAEVRTASESLATRRGSPALDRLLAPPPEPGLSFDAGAAFADRGGRPLGRLAAAYGFGRAELALAAGRWPAPLGVSSSLSARRPGAYLAAAGRWRLAGDAGSGLYAVGSAGRAGGALSPRTARTGMLYQRSHGGATWSAYAGRAWHRAAIGIPGHREADRGRSRAAHAGWEARVVLRWKF